MLAASHALQLVKSSLEISLSDISARLQSYENLSDSFLKEVNLVIDPRLLLGVKIGVENPRNRNAIGSQSRGSMLASVTTALYESASVCSLLSCPRHHAADVKSVTSSTQ